MMGRPLDDIEHAEVHFAVTELLRAVEVLRGHGHDTDGTLETSIDIAVRSGRAGVERLERVLAAYTSGNPKDAAALLQNYSARAR